MCPCDNKKASLPQLCHFDHIVISNRGAKQVEDELSSFLQCQMSGCGEDILMFENTATHTASSISSLPALRSSSSLRLFDEVLFYFFDHLSALMEIN